MRILLWLHKFHDYALKLENTEFGAMGEPNGANAMVKQYICFL